MSTSIGNTANGSNTDYFGVCIGIPVVATITNNLASISVPCPAGATHLGPIQAAIYADFMNILVGLMLSALIVAIVLH